MKRTVRIMRGRAGVLSQTLTRRPRADSVVQKTRQLRVQGNRIVEQSGAPVQLRGMSLFWSQWIRSTTPPRRSNGCATTGRSPSCARRWRRSAVGTKESDAERDKVIAVVDAAIDLGIYVIIDYHAHTAQKDLRAGESVLRGHGAPLRRQTQRPLRAVTTNRSMFRGEVLKPYHEAVIDSIREFDPDNIVIVGTRNWSHMVAEAAANPIRARERRLYAALLREHARTVLRDEHRRRWIAARRCS
jgi:endoglucanase